MSVEPEGIDGSDQWSAKALDFSTYAIETKGCILLQYAQAAAKGYILLQPSNQEEGGNETYSANFCAFSMHV